MDDARIGLLHMFLTARDVPCPGCGYNLRDLTGTKCPECGEDLVLQVWLEEPKIAAPITGLIGLAAGAGMNGLLIAFMTIRSIFFGDTIGGENARMSIILLGGFVTLGTALIVWLGKWRKIRRSAYKWLMVTGCWVLTGIDLVIFAAGV